MNSAERINYIIEYISAYEEKIKMCNNNNLFDEAKMFEIFAKDVCKLYFKQEFINLNDIKKNYPYVDLVSVDKKIYVQVSTEKYIQSKIKRTLENIRDDENTEFDSITEIYFFMLHNDSVNSVKDITGTNQIGNISFIKEKNLITTQDLIKKSIDDLTFQEGFYTLIKQEFDSYNTLQRKFHDELEISKNVCLANINLFINNEYEIDRMEIIKRIKLDNSKFISIQGSEGSGKSALCKKLVQDEELVLFARAERFVEESSIDNIWNLNINELLELLNGKKILFVIDALEFIADSSRTKVELLQSLYSIVSKYNNAYIITTCRKSDKNAFLLIESKFPIKVYDINEITEDELLLIRKNYPVIEELNKKSAYKDLLKTPFYINLIISNNILVDDINNINKFRMYIWENIICLKDKVKTYNLKYSEVVKEVETISFERAKNFLLGVDESKLDSNIIDALLIEGVIVKGKYGVRLKYDIYEDICFENFFDKELYLSKGNYNIFFKNIEKIGRSIYRRYQIWISNKLFALKDKEKIIYDFLFSDTLPEKWQVQTEIGIVKSDFCEHFFKAYETELMDNELVSKYLKIINMYSYDVRVSTINNLYTNLDLIPVGFGREGLIEIIYNNELYINNKLDRASVIKLCNDCSKQLRNIKGENTINNICLILEYYIDELLSDVTISFHKKIEYISQGMLCLFNLATYSRKWLSDFIKQLISDFNSGDNNKKRFSEDMCEWIFKNCVPSLAKELTEELCNLADCYWIANKKEHEVEMFHNGDIDSLTSMYGLSRFADNYHFNYIHPSSNRFLYYIFRTNFNIAFQWAIDFINRCVCNYSTNNNCFEEVTVKFSNQNTKKYIGNNQMWLAGVVETCVPEIMGDIIYEMKKSICEIVTSHKNDKEFVNVFLEFVKNNIFNKSNNVILLNVIAFIGLYYIEEIPGYSMDLCTSIDIINWDISRYSLYIKNPIRDTLERNILLLVGLPNGLKKRYELNLKCNLSLIDYMQKMQIYYGDKCRTDSYHVFDYLYSVVPNDTSNAMNYLQIQKMDLRGAKKTKISENSIMLKSNITGEAKKIADKKEIEIKNYNSLLDDATRFIGQYKGGNSNINDLVNIIHELLAKCADESFRLLNESNIIMMMAVALKSNNLKISDREFFINYWVNDIRKLFINDNSSSNYLTFTILIDQLKLEFDIEIKNKIKQLILDIILNESHNGIISKYTEEVKKYLKTDERLSISLFNTIIKLSEDEMNHKKYNVDYLNKKETSKKYKFVPNMNPKLYSVDKYILETGGKEYNSKKNSIIEKYLFNEENLYLNNFDIDNHDISILINICICEISIDNENFKKILKNMIQVIIKIISCCEYSNEILDIYEQTKIVDYFHEKMIRSEKYNEKLIDLLFDDIDFSVFNHDSIEFYEYVFADFPVVFFNGYIDDNIRKNCIKKLLYIEKKINSIDADTTKKHLYKILTLHIHRFYNWDISKCKTTYSYSDKMFINNMISKYGKYHIRDIFNTLYQMNIDELLPEILIALKNIFTSEEFLNEITLDERKIIDIIIINSFTKHCNEIKQQSELIDAYESILEVLINDNNEKASVILDEFRVH